MFLRRVPLRGPKYRPKFGRICTRRHGRSEAGSSRVAGRPPPTHCGTDPGPRAFKPKIARATVESAPPWPDLSLGPFVGVSFSVSTTSLDRRSDYEHSPPHDPARLDPRPDAVRRPACGATAGLRELAAPCIEGGGSVTDLMQQLGHADLATTQRYAAGLSERRRATVLAMEFSAAPAPAPAVKPHAAKARARRAS